MPGDIDNALKEATKGLLYTSETDAPFEVVHWPADGDVLDAKKVLQLSGHPLNERVERMSIDEFFEELIKTRSWFGAEEKAAAKKYQQLLAVIQQQLTGAQVFRVGEIQIDIFIVGKTAQGDWAGVQTKAVET